MKSYKLSQFRTVFWFSMIIGLAFVTKSIAQVNFNIHTLNDSFDGARSVLATDLDGDRDFDIVGGAYDGDKLYWWDNDGFQHFTERVIDNSVNGPYSIHTGDINGDEERDVVVAQYYYHVYWYENNGDKTFTERLVDNSFQGAASVFTIDIDGDNDLDIVAAAIVDDDVVWYRNSGDDPPSWNKRVLSSTFDGASGVYAGDIDGDNDIDIVAAGVVGDYIKWFENDGSENFTMRNVDVSVNGPMSVYLADINGDTDLDIVASALSDDDILWYENDGGTPPTWTKRYIDNNFNSPRKIIAIDMDLDNDIDVLSCSDADGYISWWKNNGADPPLWGQRNVTTTFTGAFGVCACDIDNDNDIDVLGAGDTNDDIAWFENIEEYDHDIAFVTPRDEYRMIGIPVYVDDGDAETLFKDNIGDLDIGAPNWRVSRWSVADSTYHRHSERDYPINYLKDPPDFSPGLGFWLKQRAVDDCELDITELQITGNVAQNSRYELTLESKSGNKRGLNQMANPYYYMYDWRGTSFYNATDVEYKSIEDAATANWISGYAYRWDDANSQYVAVNFDSDSTKNYEIGIWEGFWLEVLDTDEIRVRFKPNGWGGGLAPPQRDNEEITWALNLSLQTENGILKDQYNALGASTKSVDGYDALDAFEFSPISDSFVQLYFPHDNWEEVGADAFTYDYRSLDFTEPKNWDFVIRTWRVNSQSVILTWPNISGLDQSYSFALLDDSDAIIIEDMRHVDSYSIETGEDDLHELHLRVRVTQNPLEITDKEVSNSPGIFGLTGIYPNPFNETLKIDYNIPSISKVVLRVFDLTGREVTILTNDWKKAGNYHTFWNAKGIASGVYMLQLEYAGTVSNRKALLLR